MRVLIGQGRRKALTGQIRGYLGNLSPFRVKCYSVALRLPYLLGTPATMSGQALSIEIYSISGKYHISGKFGARGAEAGSSQMGQRTTSCSLPDPTEGSLNERKKIYGYFHKQPYNYNVPKLKI